MYDNIPGTIMCPILLYWERWGNISDCTKNYIKTVYFLVYKMNKKLVGCSKIVPAPKPWTFLKF